MEEALPLGRVLLPLGVEREVFVHPLVADEEVLITPVGGSNNGGCHDLRNVLLSAAKLLRLV